MHTSSDDLLLLTESRRTQAGPAGTVARCTLWVLLLIGWTIALVLPVPISAEAHPTWKEPLFTFSKTLHVAAYASFAATGAWVRLSRRWRWPLLAVLFAHALLGEGLQLLLESFSHRSGKWSDVVLDSLGIACGAALTWNRWPNH